MRVVLHATGLAITVLVLKLEACTDCYLSQDGLCLNSLGSGDVETKVEKLVCPFSGCSAGKNGRPMEKRKEDISRLRSHMSTHLADGFVPTVVWLADHDSRLCPGCSAAIVALTGRCGGCKARVPDSCYNVSAPKARYLPKLEKNHVVQVSLGATESVLKSGLPPVVSCTEHANGQSRAVLKTKLSISWLGEVFLTQGTILGNRLPH